MVIYKIKTQKPKKSLTKGKVKKMKKKEWQVQIGK